jgi:hypothetical protein
MGKPWGGVLLRDWGQGWERLGGGSWLFLEAWSVPWRLCFPVGS